MNTQRDTELALVRKLCVGDEVAFARLVDDLSPGLFGLARTFTRSPALAEDIVQETWLAVVRGLGAFEGRSLLRTWIYSILIRRARTMTAREKRRANGVAFHLEGAGDGAPLVEWQPGRGKAGLWEERPTAWPIDDPAELFESREAVALLGRALESIPPVQRQVVLLRDVEGFSSVEVCNVLGLSETNQRVLLHRGRARVRTILDQWFRDGSSAPRTSASRTSTSDPASRASLGSGNQARGG